MIKKIQDQCEFKEKVNDGNHYLLLIRPLNKRRVGCSQLPTLVGRLHDALVYQKPLFSIGLFVLIELVETLLKTSETRDFITTRKKFKSHSFKATM